MKTLIDYWFRAFLWISSGVLSLRNTKNSVYWLSLLSFFVLCIPFKTIASGRPPLPINQAFQVSATVQEDSVVMIHFVTAPLYYLYQNKIKFTIQKPAQAFIGQILMPKAEVKEIPLLGKQFIYQGKVDFPLPILNWNQGKLTLQVDYQGCSSQGYCYPPDQRVLEVVANPLNFLGANQKETILPSYMETNTALSWLNRQPIWLIPFGFIGFGLLLSLTPCTFPMIPILSSIILGYRQNLTTRRAFFLSLTYVLSMACVYGLIGIFIGFLGGNLQLYFQKTWVIVFFSVLFILLALCSFIGVYWLKLPEFLEKHLLKLSHQQKAGTYVGVAAMGALSTLIVSPCVTAPLIGVMSYISQTGRSGLGGVALFFMGLGMGVPLLVIGTLEARWLPKSGYWTRTIEIILGLLLLGIAISLLSKILPANFILSLWGGLFLVAALYLGAFFKSETMKAKTLRRGLASVLLIYGVSLLLGGFAGNENFFAPLRFWSDKGQGKGEIGVQANFRIVHTLKEVKSVLTEAKKNKQPVLMDVYAGWCAYCKVIEAKIFKDSDVVEKIKNFRLIKLDVTRVNSESKAVLGALNVIAPPAILFFDEAGKERHRLMGDIKKEEFMNEIGRWRHELD